MTKYLDGVLFCAVTKCFLPLANTNLHLLIACHGLHITVRHREWSCILQALPYISVGASILCPVVSTQTNLRSKDECGVVELLAPADPKVTLNKTARTEIWRWLSDIKAGLRAQSYSWVRNLLLFDHKENDTALNRAIKVAFVPWHLKGSFTTFFIGSWLKKKRQVAAHHNTYEWLLLSKWNTFHVYPFLLDWVMTLTQWPKSKAEWKETVSEFHATY